MKRPKIDHMARHGVVTHLDHQKPDETVIGRRSRKIWPCSADHDCAVGIDIDLDEVYIEHVKGTGRYNGTIHRYHVACAIKLQIVEPTENRVDRSNGRRQAIAAQRAKRAANAG